MTTTPPAANKDIAQQFLFTAVAEGLLLLGVFLLFFIGPLTPLLMVLAAVALALGVVAAIFTIYRAVRLMNDPRTRIVGYMSIAFVVGGPVLLFAVSFLL